jgi:LysM repeat protein
MRLRTSSLLLSAALLAGAVLPAALAAQSLRGSPASVDRIHRQAVNHGLHFYETSAGIHRAVENGRFVRLQGNADYRVHNVSYPFLLPEAHTFVTRLAAQYRAACGEQLVVTSALRPKSMRLANSVDRSVHPTGMAVDLRRPTNPRCLSWLRTTLLALERGGVLEAVEERRPPHFHVAVFPRPYGNYVARQGGRIARPVVAQAAAPRGGTPAVAGGATAYRVRPGGSLWAIAQRHGTTVDQLKSANSLSSPAIRAGQTLVIPAR